MSKTSYRVLFLAAEALPFAQVGGLAEVAGKLPRALRDLGHDVRLMIPRYGSIRSKDYDFKALGDPFPVPVGPGEEHVHLIETTLDDLPVYLIWDEKFFSPREHVYGFNDDAQRFSFFGRAVIAALPRMGWLPQVIHANDWHTGIVPTWLDFEGRYYASYRDIATLFTIHNLAYQGVSGRLILTFARMDNLPHLDVERPGTVNWLAQGVARADVVNTVSKRYAQEILTPELGGGLDSLLRARQDRLSGVLNGLDYDLWNPASDGALVMRYDAETPEKRAVNKAALQQEARLPVRADVPLVALVSQLEHVKGVDLLESALPPFLNGQMQFIVQGTGEPGYQQIFERLHVQHPDAVRTMWRDDEAMARRIYAGSDLVLIPSRVEPGGQSQFVALRYGSVPVVHATGGLADAVVDYSRRPDRGTGFTFVDSTPEALSEALGRALSAFGDRETWQAIQQRGMHADFTWRASAREYAKLYQRALELHAKR